MNDTLYIQIYSKYWIINGTEFNLWFDNGQGCLVTNVSSHEPNDSTTRELKDYDADRWSIYSRRELAKGRNMRGNYYNKNDRIINQSPSQSQSLTGACLYYISIIIITISSICSKAATASLFLR